ncbi:transporter substrate-binding domain-containing protein [Vibrio maerlii]|uniref:transporter substrate-binding domain-containing protein n=1 Tax=Vibrio maerlii TaxID=2231648 RepID=UPI000E3B9818|nr:transporter substrate-binding domain-containing protein [Vibrio maerlii]
MRRYHPLTFLLGLWFVFSETVWASKVNLTEEEQLWIENAPTIKTNNSNDNAPFDFIENGVPTGYSIEYLQLLGNKLGLSFEFVQDKTWSEYKQFSEDKHIDLLHLVSKAEDRERYLIYTKPYFKGSQNLLYGKKSKPAIENHSELNEQTISVVRDTVEQRFLSQHYPNIKLNGVDSINEGLNSILRGEGDYFLCYPSVCETQIRQRFLTLVESRGHLGIEELAAPKEAHFAVRNDWPILTSILNKAISSVTPDEKKRLLDKWIYQTRNTVKVETSLSESELNWIEKNQRLVFSQPTKYAPYSYVEDNGTLGGLAADLVEDFSNKYELQSYYVDYSSWSDTYQALLDGEIDYIPTININEKRKREVLLTEPVLTYYLTIFSHDDGPVFNNLSALSGYRVGISKNSSVARLLRETYPDLKYVTYKNGVDVYKALSEGKVDAAAASPHVMYHTINEYGLENIVKSAETEFKFELAIAIHPSKPELLALFNKLIFEYQEGEIDELMDKWTKIKVVHRTDWYSIAYWGMGFTLIAILSIVLILTRNKARTIKLLAENDKRLNNAQRVAKIGNWELNSSRQLVQISQQVRVLLGLASDISLSQENYAQFIHPDDKDGVKASWKRAMKTGIYQHEYRIIVNDEERWVREVAELSFDHDGLFSSANGIIQDINEQKLIELKVKENEAELRGLTSKLLHVQEEERRRVARELHDDLSQRLAVLSISIGTLELDKTLLPAKDRLNAIKQDLASVAKDVHGLSRRLHPSILDDLGLIDALKSEISSYVDREMIAVHFETTENQLELSKQSELGLFRITQESLRNIAKYSEASKVLVTINVINRHLILKIIDDGIGFDVKEAMKSPGLGLQSMTERARLINATIDITSNDKGTTVSVDMPV